MMSCENITPASTPKEWSQSVTLEKENTRQSNANYISNCLWYLFEMLPLHLYIRKLGRNIIKLVVMKDRNCKAD